MENYILEFVLANINIPIELLNSLFAQHKESQGSILIPLVKNCVYQCIQYYYKLSWSAAVLTVPFVWIPTTKDCGQTNIDVFN